MGSNEDTPGDGPITEADLHAWLDGELSPARCAAVEAYLAEHPDDLERVERYRAHGDLIARAYAPVRDAPPFVAAAPVAAAFVTASVAAPAGRRSAAGRAAIAAAAAFALFVSGMGAGWVAHGQRDAAVAQSTSAVSDALAAHRLFVAEVRHPVEVAADQEAHLIAWLSRRLGQPVTAPRLDPVGFTLMGGRLLPSDGGPAAQFMYQNAAGERVTLFVRPSPDAVDVAFRFVQEGGAAAFYWRDRGLSWALSGEADRERLQEIARRVYAALNA